MSIYKKLLVLIIGTVVILVATLGVLGGVLISKTNSKAAATNISSIRRSVQSTIDGTLETLQAFAGIITLNKELAKAMAEGDGDRVRAIAKQLVDFPTIELVTVCDMTGKILARGHLPDKFGDTFGPTRLSCFIPIKEGRTIYGLEQGQAVRLTMNCGVPVFYEGKQVGVVIVGIPLSSNEFVESIKKNFGVEATIFMEDERVSTTIQNGGTSLIGTKLNNPEISEAVLKKGETVIRHNAISGKNYDTVYWPWKDINGKIGGMLFVGSSREELES